MPPGHLQEAAEEENLMRMFGIGTYLGQLVGKLTI